MSKALHHYVYLDLAGFPFILRSDNGFEFVAEVIKELNHLVGTHQVFGSASHPQAQGLVEGSHKPVEHVIQQYVDEFPENWASQLPVAR